MCSYAREVPIRSYPISFDLTFVSRCYRRRVLCCAHLSSFDDILPWTDCGVVAEEALYVSSDDFPSYSLPVLEPVP